MKNKNIIPYLAILYGFAKAVAGDISMAEEIKPKGKLEEMVPSEASSSYRDEILAKKKREIDESKKYENPYGLLLEGHNYHKSSKEEFPKHPRGYGGLDGLVIGGNYYNIDQFEGFNGSQKGDIYFGELTKEGNAVIKVKKGKIAIVPSESRHVLSPSIEESGWKEEVQFPVYGSDVFIYKNGDDYLIGKLTGSFVGKESMGILHESIGSIGTLEVWEYLHENKK